MSRHQLRLLLLAGVTLGLMVASMFVMPWFKLGGLGSKIEIDLRSFRMCGLDGACASVPMSKLEGMYPTLAVVAFWSNCVLGLALAYQAGMRVFGGAAGEGLTRIGYLLAVLCLLGTGAAGFMFGPQPQTLAMGVSLVRTWGPALLVIADLLAMVVLYLSTAEVFDTAHVGSTPRVPSSPIPRASTAPIPAGSFPIPRPAKVESAQPLTASFKPRPSSVPLDDNAEATQADPTPATVPERLPQRTKAPSSVPFLTDTDLPAAPVLDPGLAGMASSPPAPLVSDVVDIPEHVAPDAKPRPTLSFAVERATLSASGISATRERDVKQVAWTDIVGVVARRLPADAPYDGATFVDVVSTAGSTLRVLPWTQLDDELGDAGDGSGEERARALVQLVARRCPDAKLDGATRTFLGGRGHAAQLPNADTLAQHDARLA